MLPVAGGTTCGCTAAFFAVLLGAADPVGASDGGAVSDGCSLDGSVGVVVGSADFPVDGDSLGVSDASALVGSAGFAAAGSELLLTSGAGSAVAFLASGLAVPELEPVGLGGRGQRLTEAQHGDEERYGEKQPAHAR